MKPHIFSAVVGAGRFEDGSAAFHAWCPAPRGCHTWGRSEREALTRLEEAVELYLDGLRAAGEPIPVDPERGAIARPSPAARRTWGSRC
jgi:predicted RNase H-like HicB family nuclease